MQSANLAHLNLSFVPVLNKYLSIALTLAPPVAVEQSDIKMSHLFAYYEAQSVLPGP